MFRKLTIIIASLFLLAFSANAGSDGQLELKTAKTENVRIALKN